MNKRLRKFVSQINELWFRFFHISCVNNFLSNSQSRFPTGKSGNDRGDGPNGANKVVSKVKTMSASTSAIEERQVNPNDLPLDAQSDYPNLAQIFA